MYKGQECSPEIYSHILEKQETALREKAFKLLSEHSVDVVLGLKENKDAGHPTPLFATEAEDAERLVWNEDCYTHLSIYLLDLKGRKTAIAAKPKDRENIMILLAEGQLNKDDVVILDMDWEDEKLPSVTEWVNETSTEERFERFLHEIDKCTLCFSCRQACPGCYCESCYLERKATPWLLNDAGRSTKVMYHLTRAMHLAGRCSDCRACRDACEFGVDLQYLMRGVREFLLETYDYQPGISEEQVSAMNDFSPSDYEIGFLGGDNR